MLCSPRGQLVPLQAGGTAGALLPAMPELAKTPDAVPGAQQRQPQSHIHQTQLQQRFRAIHGPWPYPNAVRIEGLPEAGPAAAAAAAAAATAAATDAAQARGVAIRPPASVALQDAAQAAQRAIAERQQPEMRWLAWRVANGLPTDRYTPEAQQRQAALAVQQLAQQQQLALQVRLIHPSRMMPKPHLPLLDRRRGEIASGTRQAVVAQLHLRGGNGDVPFIGGAAADSTASKPKAAPRKTGPMPAAAASDAGALLALRLLGGKSTFKSDNALPACTRGAAAAATAPPDGLTGRLTSAVANAAATMSVQFWCARAAVARAVSKTVDWLASAMCRASCGRRAAGCTVCQAASCRRLATRIVLSLQLAILAMEVLRDFDHMLNR